MKSFVLMLAIAGGLAFGIGGLSASAIYSNFLAVSAAISAAR